jgi:ATP-dependent RNA helicase DeaD
MLFSATLPPRIDGMARRHLKDPVRIHMGRESTEPGEAPLVRQTAYVVPRAHKPAALGRVLDVEAPAAAIVFCRTRDEVDTLTEHLNGRGYRAEGLHGGLTQEQRDRVMGRLRSGTADLLIATDVAARGLDIDHLTHVINYDVPSAPDSYVHRIGRVGRAGREGVAITLAEPREHGMLKTIERVTRQRITVEKLPTIADLRARRLELTRAALEESIREDDLEHFRVVVESLCDEFDVMEVALAAVKLAHEASGAAAMEEEIPDVAPRPARDGGGAGGGHDPAVHRVGPGRGHPATGPGGRHRRRDQPERARHRGHRDRRPLLAGGGAGGGGRRRHRRHAQRQHQGQADHGAPRARRGPLGSSDRPRFRRAGAGVRAGRG